MNNQILQTLKGFRDFLPEEKRQRDFVQNKIIEIFDLFGFEPLETPTLEYAELLLGKYGDEADKLVYTFDDKGGRKVGLRYDQTVPTARLLSQYRNNLPRFFRRYQIQNVFRADKPQKSRYREFAQCDVDIFGTTSSLADAEILACTYFVYKNIGFKQIVLKVNDRKTLINALQPFATDLVDVFSIIQSIDKLDKQTQEEVMLELEKKGLATTQAQAVIKALNKIKPSDNLQAIIKQAIALGVPSEILVYSPSLARGLDYYTGLIFEISLPEFTAGSCGGGGRYDNLIGNLSSTSMPAVGVGLGFDRTVEAAVQLGIVPAVTSCAKVLVSVFSQDKIVAALGVAKQLRQANIKTTIYPEIDNLGKQFKYASQQQIPWVIVIGDDEVLSNQVSIKNMQTGDQQQLSLEEAIKIITSSC